VKKPEKQEKRDRPECFRNRKIDYYFFLIPEKFFSNERAKWYGQEHRRNEGNSPKPGPALDADDPAIEPGKDLSGMDEASPHPVPVNAFDYGRAHMGEYHIPENSAQHGNDENPDKIIPEKDHRRRDSCLAKKNTAGKEHRKKLQKPHNAKVSPAVIRYAFYLVPFKWFNCRASFISLNSSCCMLAL
jgi:hypothetical protein